MQQGGQNQEISLLFLFNVGIKQKSRAKILCFFLNEALPCLQKEAYQDFNLLSLPQKYKVITLPRFHNAAGVLCFFDYTRTQTIQALLSYHLY